MRNAYLMSAGAGIVSAIALLLSAVAFPPLLPFAGVPIFVVGLVWGYAAALLAAATGVLALSVVSDEARMTLALFLGLPAVALTYLASTDWLRNAQGLPAALSSQVGRIVLGAAILGGLFSALMMVGVHEKVDEFRQELTKAIEESYQYTGQPAPSVSEVSATADTVIRLLPATLALTATVMNLFSLWVAGRLLRAAGLLNQPWPDLAAFRFPPGTPIVLAVSLICALTLSEGGALVATSLSSALLVAFLLLGLAVIHYVTRGKRWRPVALLGVYIGLLWLAVPIIALGLLDTVFPLRKPRSADTGTS